MCSRVSPTYGAINAIRDICEPWIEMWGGDEWGESMRNLHGAAHTSYGLSEEDCATVAEILLRNVITQREWMESTGHNQAQARAGATRARDYWLKGGNLGSFGTTAEDAKTIIDAMPNWMFE